VAHQGAIEIAITTLRRRGRMYIRLVIECSEIERSDDKIDAIEMCSAGGDVVDDSLKQLAVAVEELVSLALLQRFSTVGVLEVTLYKWSWLDP
jgi:hypothetical protein